MKENMKKIEIVNAKLSIIRSRIKNAIYAQDAADETIKKLLPEGKRITFKRGNMKFPAEAIVMWSRMIQGCADLRITNIETGKDRTIPFDDVVEIL